VTNHDARRREPGRAKSLKIIYHQTEDLKLDPGNPRVHSKKHIGQIAESIRIFGFNVPILIDREGKVIAGHGRLLACRELAITEVPTLCLDHLTQAQARAFMIADNRLTEIASWDDQLLAEQLKDLSLSGLDFSLVITGFEMGEIDLRIASLEDTLAQEPTRLMSCSRSRANRRSARPEICGSLAIIASCAATPSIPRPSRP
jgi:ParB-like chromosome segregation protein Spo0J